MTVRRTILNVEELAQRILPSLSPLNPIVASAVAHMQAAHHSHHALAGHGSGTYTASNLQADIMPPLAPPGSATPIHIIVGDIGEEYDFAGTADLARLGHVNVSGSILAPGNIAVGHASGTLTFTNAHGSVTIDVTGPSRPGFSPLPTHFQYTIVGGTGAYQHLHDQGTLQLTLQPSIVAGEVAPVFPSAEGTFTLSIP